MWSLGPGEGSDVGPDRQVPGKSVGWSNCTGLAHVRLESRDGHQWTVQRGMQSRVTRGQVFIPISTPHHKSCPHYRTSGPHPHPISTPSVPISALHSCTSSFHVSFIQCLQNYSLVSESDKLLPVYCQIHIVRVTVRASHFTHWVHGQKAFHNISTQLSYHYCGITVRDVTVTAVIPHTRYQLLRQYRIFF